MSYSLSGINLEPNLLTDSLKNLDSAAVERIIIKCNHTTIFAEMNYVTYTYSELRFEKGKSHPGHNILQLKMAH